MRFYQNLLLFLIVFVGVALPLFVTPALAYYGNNQYYGYTQNSGYRQRQRMMDTYSSLPNDLEASTEKIPSLEVKSCIKINSIQVDGVTKISDSTIESVTKPWKGKCVTLTDINTILDGLNKVYITRRFVNSRAYLPKQDASNGHLTILMMENTVDAFYFSGRAHALHEIFAFPWVRGSVLNLNDLEQGLDQMNRLPNWNATMKFLPGSQDTNTTVNVHVPPVNKIQGKVLVDNLSQSGVGRTMGRASVGASDILGILDQWSFEYDHSLNNRQSEGNNSYFDSELSIPLGAWLLSAGWWRSDEMLYTQPFINTQPPSTTKKRSDSTQKDFHVGVSRVIARHKVDITTLSVSYELKSFQNYTNHQRIPSQSARLASLNVTLGEFMKIWGKTWYIDIGAKIGLGGAGTKTWSDEQGKFGSHTQYIKPYLNVDGYKPITKLLMWHTVIHGEYSSRNQYGNEWLSIGGPFTVRGFLKSTAIGNAGIFMRNDLSLQMPTKNLSCGRYDIFCNGLLKGTEFYGIIDTGMTRAVYTYENMPKLVKSADIAGAGIGFRKTDGFIQWDTSATHAITTSGMPPEGWIISFQVGLKM